MRAFQRRYRAVDMSLDFLVINKVSPQRKKSPGKDFHFTDSLSARKWRTFFGPELLFAVSCILKWKPNICDATMGKGQKRR
jgi:hypothetical protein